MNCQFFHLSTGDCISRGDSYSVRRGDEGCSGTHQPDERKEEEEEEKNDEEARSRNQLKEKSNAIDSDQVKEHDDRSLKVSHSGKKAPTVPPRSIDSQLSRSPEVNHRSLLVHTHGQVSRITGETTSHRVTDNKLLEQKQRQRQQEHLATREDEDESKRNTLKMSDYPCNDSESSVTRDEDKNTCKTPTAATTTTAAATTARAKGKSKSDSSFASSSSTATCDLQYERDSSMHQSKFREVNKCQCSDKNDTQCQSTHQLLSRYDEMNEVKSVQVTNDAHDDIQSDKYDSLGEEINSEDEIVDDDATEHYTFNEAVDGESDQLRQEEEDHEAGDEEEDEEEEEDDEDYLKERMQESCKARNMLNESDSGSILRSGNKLKISLHYSSEKSSVANEVATGRANATSKLFQKNRHTLNRRIGSSHVLQPIYKSSASSTSKSNKIIKMYQDQHQII